MEAMNEGKKEKTLLNDTEADFYTFIDIDAIIEMDYLHFACFMNEKVLFSN